MRNDLHMDNALRETLHSCADDIRTPDTLKSRIDNQLKAAPVKKSMIRSRRTALVAAAMVCALAFSAYAAASMVSISSHSRSNQRLSYTEAIKHAQQINTSALLPEAFSNGLAYENAVDVNREATDAEGNVAPFLALSATYKNSSQEVTLVVDPAAVLADAGMTESTASETKTVGDTMISYYQMEYKAVPPTYRPTEEEQERVEDGTLAIGYGADEISVSQNEGAYMTVNGVRYELFASDQALGADEMLAMLEELLG